MRLEVRTVYVSHNTSVEIIDMDTHVTGCFQIVPITDGAADLAWKDIISDEASHAWPLPAVRRAFLTWLTEAARDVSGLPVDPIGEAVKADCKAPQA